MVTFISEMILFFGSFCTLLITALVVLALVFLVVVAVIRAFSWRKKRRANRNLINALKALDKIDGNALDVVSKLMQAHGAYCGTKERVKRAIEEDNKRWGI